VKQDRLPHEVRILAVVAACVALGFGIVAPAIPVFAKSFGVSNFAASSVISVFALMRFVSAFAGGRLVDRFGERLILGTGIGIVGVSSAMAGFSHSFVQLLALRGIGGAGSALFSVSSTSLLLRVVRAEQRGRASGTVQAGFLIGGIAGPAVGGPLSEWSLRAPFFVYAATLVVAGSVAVIALAKSQLSAKSALAPGEHPMTLSQALRFPAYRAALTNGFANGWALFGVRSALVPLFVVEGLQVDRRWTGIGLLFWALVEGLALRPAGRASDSRGRRPLLLGGGAALMLSALILSVAGAIPAYLAGMAIYGSGSAMLGVSSAAVVGDVIRGRGGRPVAAYQMSADAGTFLGPLVCGFLSDAFDFRVAFLVTAVVSAVAFTASLRMPETRVVQQVSGSGVAAEVDVAPERPVEPGPLAAD
jgi:MFS family permease